MSNPTRFILVDNKLPGIESLRSLLASLRPRPELGCATSLDDGFELLQQGPASGLFLDLTLLGERAEERIRGLRKLQPHMPIFGLANDVELAAHARRTRWVDESLLLGQLDATVLSMALRHTIRQRRLKQELKRTRRELRTAEDRASELRRKTDSDAPSRATAPLLVDGALAQAQKMEALGQLTSGLAHDFNNLLAVIIGNLQLIQRSNGGDERLGRQAAAALDAASRGAKLTRQMLAIARRQPLEPRALDLGAQLAEFREILERTLGKVELQISARPDAWLAMADPSLLESAVLNLCINARDAMPQGGTLRISVENRSIGEQGEATAFGRLASGEYVCLTVSDDGAGMDSATLARVIEPFFTTKAPGKGTGLGLSMVHAFAVQSGGQLDLRSESGLGTAAAIYLPKASTSEIDVTSKTLTRLTEVPTGDEHILLVEDDESVREMAREMLRNLGYMVREADSGEAALTELHTDAEVDLLLTDVVMPGKIDGLRLGQKVRQRYPTVKVLYTSGYVGASAGKNTIKLAQPLLGKPYRINELAAKVREVLDEPDAA